MKAYNFVCCLFIFIMFVLALPQPAVAAARMSGKILSINANVYHIELGDGSKIQIKMKEGAKRLRSQGTGAFRIGEKAVFNVISALNDNPLLADSIMDALYASQNSTKAYVMPRDTRIGGFQTAAGPAATGGAKPNVVGSIGVGGSKNLSPSINVNAPFTASPAALNTPFTGEALTTGNIQMPQTPNAPGAQIDAMSPYSNSQQKTSPMSPLNTQAPSGMYNQPYDSGIQTQQPINLTLGDQSGMTDPSSMITGSSRQTNPQTMIYGEGAFGKSGGNADPSMIFGGSQDDEDEDEEDPLAALNPSGASAAGAPVQVTGKLMNCDISQGVLFYMVSGVPGMQELGSAVVTPQTVIIDARTGGTIQYQNIAAGATLQIDGIKRGDSAITAVKITVLP